MLYALRHPLALVALVLGFLIAVTLRGVVQARLAAALGDRSALAYGRGGVDPRRHLDPFGAVAAALGGIGWGRPQEDSPFGLRQRNRLVLVLLAGPAAMLLAGAVLIAGYVGAGGDTLGLDQSGIVPSTVRGGFVLANPLHTLLLFAGIELVAMAILDLVPLPPLDGGRLLFLLAPRSAGWQRAEYYLSHQNIGVAVLLALLIIPLAGNEPLLIFVVDLIVHPILHLATLGGTR